MQRDKRPREAFAARCQFGQPPGELEAVARRAGDFENDRDPALARPAGPDVAGERAAGLPVVADGHWLVFDASLAALDTLTGGERDLPARSPISRSADRAARPYTWTYDARTDHRRHLACHARHDNSRSPDQRRSVTSPGPHDQHQSGRRNPSRINAGLH